MKSYKFLTIDGSYNQIEVMCTDEKVLEWIISLVKEIVPSCDYSINGSWAKNEEFFKKYIYRITKLKDKGDEIGWWLMEQLGQHGWEPFSGGGLHTSFRFESET